MRILFPILLIIIIFGVNGFLITKTINTVFLHSVSANNYTALDFAPECDDFYVTIGVSKENGRYVSYSYEFSE